MFRSLSNCADHPQTAAPGEVVAYAFEIVNHGDDAEFETVVSAPEPFAVSLLEGTTRFRMRAGWSQTLTVELAVPKETDLWTTVPLSLRIRRADDARLATSTTISTTVAFAMVDGDAVLAHEDNCPNVANADQEDLDEDGLGDLCDEDADGDGEANVEDNCPRVSNPNQEDLDKDGLGDPCDPDPNCGCRALGSASLSRSRGWWLLATSLLAIAWWRLRRIVSARQKTGAG